MAQSRHRLQTLSVHNHFRNVRLFKEQELGHGSFATVCRAVCDSLLCAAKVLHPEFFDQGDPGEENFVAKFIEECNILPSITHPNIVQCFGTYQDPETDLPVLLMELMDESLTDYLERAGEPLPFHAEVSFSYDVALGLSYLHSRGYIHRDLSSNNVLVMAGVRAKITDFGMCRAMSGPNQSRLTQCPGTQAYMPPEALVEHPVYTAKLDVFSYGVLMIQIMSRHSPKPGPAHRILPNGSLEAIAEEERRENHIIKCINFEHQNLMLPVAKRCIKNSPDQRPSSDEICSELQSLKESQTYKNSKDDYSVESKLQRAERAFQKQLTDVKAENSQVIEGIHDNLLYELNKIKFEHEVCLQRLQSKHHNEIERLRGEHSQLQSKHHEEIERLRGEHLQLQSKHHEEIERLRGEHLQLQSKHHEEIERLRGEHSQLQSKHHEEIERLRGEHSREIERIHNIYQQNLREQANKSINEETTSTEPSPHSKEDYNKVDKTLDKSRGVGKDSVDPKYINQNPPIVIARSPSDSVRKGGSIPFDTQRPSSDGQTTGPIPMPRSKSFSCESMLLKNDKGGKPIPRPRSQQNLLSTTPPQSPQWDVKTQRKLSMHNDKNTSSIIPGSVIQEPVERTSVHFEAQTSHEFDSPLQSIEQMSMGSESELFQDDNASCQGPGYETMFRETDVNDSTSHDNASSACSGEKTFTEIDVHDSLGSWVQVDVETHHEEIQPSSLDKEPTFIRKRSDAFSTRPAKTDKAAQNVENILDPRLVQVSFDIQSAIPCWYCTNLTNDRICDVCGNTQEQNKDTQV